MVRKASDQPKVEKDVVGASKEEVITVSDFDRGRVTSLKLFADNLQEQVQKGAILAKAAVDHANSVVNEIAAKHGIKPEDGARWDWLTFTFIRPLPITETQEEEVQPNNIV